jgi:hypothetical protein
MEETQSSKAWSRLFSMSHTHTHTHTSDTTASLVFSNKRCFLCASVIQNSRWGVLVKRKYLKMYVLCLGGTISTRSTVQCEVHTQRTLSMHSFRATRQRVSLWLQNAYRRKWVRSPQPPRQSKTRRQKRRSSRCTWNHQYKIRVQQYANTSRQHHVIMRTLAYTGYSRCESSSIQIGILQ